MITLHRSKQLVALLWRCGRATTQPQQLPCVSQIVLDSIHQSTPPCTGRIPSISWYHTSSSALFRTSPHLCASHSPSKLVQFPLAQTGEGIKECELIQWFVKVGDTVEMFDKVCEVQSDKAAVEITSRYGGTITRLHHDVGDIVQVGEPLVDIELQGEGMEVAEAVPAPPPDAALQQHPTVMALPGDAHVPHIPTMTPPSSSTTTLASPAVRALARTHQLDLSRIHGTGPGGRIVKADVLAFVQGSVGQDATSSSSGDHAGSSSGVVTPLKAHREGIKQGDVTVPLRGFRRAMVRSMEASNAVPHFHYCDEIDLTQLIVMRGRIKDDARLGGVKLTFLPFVIKALSESLKQFPEVNSSLASDGASLVQHGSHNIGIAMATPNGLVVPNIKGVQDKSLVELAHEIARLQSQAAANKLPQDVLTGGTVTLSNIGTVGGTYATPRVTPPESAILALGKLQQLPRYDAHGALAPAAILRASWGADHRVVDGATLARCSNAWKELLECPDRLVLV